MKNAEAKKLVCELRNMGQDADVKTKYQARGQLGKRTTAIRCDSLIDAGRALERAGIDHVPEFETLGLGYVIW